MKNLAIGFALGVAATVAYAMTGAGDEEEYEIIYAQVIDSDMAGELVSSNLNDRRRNAHWN